MTAAPAPRLHFDALPEVVRVNIFLLLGPSDLNSCVAVSKTWRDFITSELFLSERNKAKTATYRQVFGKLVTNKEVQVDTEWMLACHDPEEKMLYVLSKPASGDEWVLKQYECGGLLELASVTLVTTHFVRGMQLAGGHLVFSKQVREEVENIPAVFDLASMPWGGSLPIESGIPLPESGTAAPHFRMLMVAKDCLFLVSKNAHVTFTRSVHGGGFDDETHGQFAMDSDRPVVVHRLAKASSGAWQEVARLHPKHPFKIMQKFSHIPSANAHENHKDEVCLLYLDDNIISNRYILVCCPLHGSYELFDYEHDFSMWKFSANHLPLESVRNILKDSQVFSTFVLAAVREAYIFIYGEIGRASLLSVESGELLRHVAGDKFVLSHRHVLPVALVGGKREGVGVSVTDAVSGETSPTFTLPRTCLSMDTFGDKPWHHNDQAYSDFEGIAKQLLPAGPKRPVFERRAETSWGYGHSMVDATRMVSWVRQSNHKFKIRLASLRLEAERASKPRLKN